MKIFIVLPHYIKSKYTREDIYFLSVLINKIMKTSGISKENITLYPFYRDTKNVKITKTQLKKFRDSFIAKISLEKPDLIISFGSSVSSVILNSNNFNKLFHTIMYLPEFDSFLLPCLTFNLYKDNNTFLDLMLSAIRNFNPNQKEKDFVAKALFSTEEILDIIEKAKKYPYLGIDVETTGLNIFAKDFKLLSFALAFNNIGYAFPVDLTLQGKNVLLDRDIVVKALIELLKMKKIFVGHNIKFDIKAIYKTLGVKIQYPFVDTMLLSYVRNENSNYNLESLLAAFGFKSHKNIDWSNKIYKTGSFSSMEQIENFLIYNAKDAIATVKLSDLLVQKFDEKSKKVNQLISKVTNAFVDMELHGFKINRKRLKELEKETEQKIKELQNKMITYPEVQKALASLGAIEFNPRSTQQIAKIFIMGKYPIIEKTSKGNISTNSYVLNVLANRYEIPFAKDLLEYRTLTKIYTSYIQPYLYENIVVDDYVHPVFHVTATKSGRASCSNPNIQQIPRGSDFKSIFVPDGEDYFLVNGDYSQMELRVEAMLSEDKHLGRAYKEGLDVHKYTASLVFGKPIEEITHEERQMAKTVNFAILYGASAFGIAKTLGKSESEIEQFMKKWYSIYNEVSSFNTKIVKFIQKNKYIETPFGRKRHLADIDSKDKKTEEEAKRQGINFVIQSTASDISFLTIVKFHDFLKNKKSKIVNMVHDSIMISVHKDEIYEILPELKKMAEDYDFDFMNGIPLKFELEIGKNWKNLVEIECDDILTKEAIDIAIKKVMEE